MGRIMYSSGAGWDPGRPNARFYPWFGPRSSPKRGVYAVVQTTHRGYDDTSPMLAGPSQHGGVG
jgi:hypothetical protein